MTDNEILMARKDDVDTQTVLEARDETFAARDAAQDAQEGAETAETNAEGSATAAATSAGEASDSATAASTSETNASNSAAAALGSANNASDSADLAQAWATLLDAEVEDIDYSAKEWAIGTTVPDGSAKFWAEEASSVVAGALQASENLADLDHVPTALTNLTADTTGVALFQSDTPATARGVLELGTAAQVNTGNNPGTVSILGVGEQAQHDNPANVTRLARLDRLYAAPGWHHIETRKITSAVSGVTFELPSEFDMFRFDIVNFNSNGTTKLGCRVSLDGGLSYDDGASDYRFALSYTGGGGGSADDSKIDLSNTSSSDGGTIFAIDGSFIANCASGRFRISGTYTLQTTTDGLIWAAGVAGGSRASSNIPTNILFYDASDGSDIVQGTFVVSGARG